ncbi:NAD(P)H-binding protein [Streptomyces sp. A3M-1-3]|uniref:SDR family oxidoreductase n=1 Tax=Streptomyces sp. A3M-1-3 TaxID=2962044 RepID=UPI0020B82E70|nr:NAD(P)H-binding protein [Streptomyces sp. A3M-1-3]MCP3817004.1 NAD(P)H-binding protein [Streptomyces sp. A3M-1-3]
MTTILVTGGTGTLGSLVTARLRAAGHEVRVLSRHAQPYAVDLREGTGLDAAMGGVEVVVHCASTPRGGDDRAAGHLIDAARQAGVAHLVYISIVGVDRLPLGYYTTKRKVERMIEESGLGWTVLRTTQFHDLVLGLLRTSAKLPVMLVPAGVSVQPIDTAEVADRLAELAAGPPAGRVPDLGGPEIRPLPDLARAYLHATGRSRPVLPVRLAGKAYAGYRRGLHLTPDRALGKTTFEDFLSTHAPAARNRRRPKAGRRAEGAHLPGKPPQ